MDDVLKRVETLISKHSIGRISKFARLTSISDSTIRGWFRLNTHPTSINIEKICRATGVSADWLLTGKNEVPEQPKEEENLEIKLAGILYFRGEGKPSEKLKLAILREMESIIKGREQKKAGEK